MDEKNKLTLALILTVIGFTLSFLATPLLASGSFVTIGTGSVTGVYYPAGGAICRLVNKGRKHHGVRCSVESTEGSVYNINAVRSGDLNMGVSQSDWQYHAYHGTGAFKEQGPYQELRSLFSLHPEPFTVVARADAGIRSFDGLKGKRVNIGSPGSGQRNTMQLLMNALSWSNSTFSSVYELKESEQASALCEDRIDAMVYIVGHPNSAIKEATTICGALLVDVTGPVIDGLVKQSSSYRKVVIPGGMYRGNSDDIHTFGVGATLVSSTAIDAETIYHVVKSVFENFDEFKSLHPALSNLKKSEMVKEGLTAPLHEGALKYYKEVGLL